MLKKLEVLFFLFLDISWVYWTFENLSIPRIRHIKPVRNTYKYLNCSESPNGSDVDIEKPGF